jgi:hypothetical protein
MAHHDPGVAHARAKVAGGSAAKRSASFGIPVSQGCGPCGSTTISGLEYGRDIVDHRVGGRDDIANVIAGVVHALLQKPEVPTAAFGTYANSFDKWNRPISPIFGVVP